ncbi:MAG: threonine--tRNA ligase, partial [Candidatus Hermodarchaeia archaeon]|jgi:hypothetical protein
VIGDKEVKAKEFPVTIRDKSSTKKPHSESMTPKALAQLIHEASQDKPFRQLSMPKQISMWPIFI